MPARTRKTRPVAARAVAGRIGLATATEVAAYLGKSEQTLANWRWQRKGPQHAGKGRGLRYDWADVDAWLASQTRGAA